MFDCTKKLFFSGLFLLASLGALVCSGYIYIDEYEQFNCGNMKTCVTLAIISIFAFIVSFLMFISSSCFSCCYKILLIVSSLFVTFSFFYNFWYYNELSKECIQHYQDEDLWEFYNILLTILGICMIVSAIFVCCSFS